MSEPFQGVIALRVGFLLADLDSVQVFHALPASYSYPLSLFAVHIPLLFYDVRQHLKKQNLIFVQYSFSHYLCF